VSGAFINEHIWDWANDQIVANDEKGNGYKFYKAWERERKRIKRLKLLESFMNGGTVGKSGKK